jgi:DNA-binding protein HU-beta
VRDAICAEAREVAPHPIKIDVFCTFPFTPASLIPYDELSKCGQNPPKTYISGESVKGESMAAKMTQSQMVKELAAATGVANKVAKSFMLAYSEMAVRETKKNGMCILPGIGRLVRVDRKARMGRNPATGEAIKIPAKKVVKFRVAKAVKDAIVPPKKK